MMAAIFYHPEAYSTDGPKLMGRNAAGDSFLRAFFQYSRPAKYVYAQVAEEEHARLFVQELKLHGRTEETVFIERNSLRRARKAGVVYYPGPNICDAAIQRRLYGDLEWSLCGITHTTASASSMDSIAALLTSPVQSWDAIICPSRAVQENVHEILDSHKAELRSRLGATRFITPKTPVIPLGVHTKDFQFTEHEKTEAKNALSLSDDEIVVLYLGRLSFHAKAHPLAMYSAAAQAQRITKKKVTIIECGWHHNDFIREAYREASALFPNLSFISLDGRDAGNRKNAWASADIFCSLSDNIQETYGITPVEAMSAGIPSIVSDWNGYRDTVRDGIDGFRIPTLAPAPGLLRDLSQRYAFGVDSYDRYCGNASSFVSVDPLALERAFVDLISSKGLREKMGMEAATRAREVFDWGHVMTQYEDLWSELNHTREFYRRRSVKVSRSSSWSTKLDPSVGFKNYPSQSLDEDTKVFLTTDKAAALEMLREYRDLRMVSYSQDVLPDEHEIISILDRAMKTPLLAKELIAHAPREKRAYFLRSLSWLVKLGILSFK